MSMYPNDQALNYLKRNTAFELLHFNVRIGVSNNAEKRIQMYLKYCQAFDNMLYINSEF